MTESTQLVHESETLPSRLISEAMRPEGSVEKLHALLAVREAWEASEARKAYNIAISEFQRRAPIIKKGDDANGKPYAALDRIWRTIRDLLTELGLSVTWQLSELRDMPPLGLVCHIEGTLRHRAGHGEKLTYDLPVPDAITNRDGRAVQNKAQVKGSADSYAKRYCLCAALGIVTGEDDDADSLTPRVSEAQMKELADLLDACRGIAGFDEGSFWKWLNTHSGVVYEPDHPKSVNKLSQIPAEGFANVRSTLKAKLAKKL